MKFNTAIAALMEYLNEIAKPGAAREDVVTLIKLLAPFAPHLADEAWETLGERGFVLEAGWPPHDAALDKRRCGDGRGSGQRQAARHRASCRAARREDEVRARALALPSVAKHLEARTITKVVVVPDKIVSVVVE